MLNLSSLYHFFLFFKNLVKLYFYRTFNNLSSCRSLLKRANEYTKENIEVIYRYQIDFERNYGNVEDLEKTEEKLTSFLLKREEEEGKMKAIKENNNKGLKTKFDNKKRKHEEIAGDNEEPGVTKKQKIEKKETHHPQFKDTKYFLFFY